MSYGKLSKGIFSDGAFEGYFSSSLRNGVDLAVELSWGKKSDVETRAVCMSYAQNDRILMYVNDLWFRKIAGNRGIK